MILFFISYLTEYLYLNSIETYVFRVHLVSSYSIFSSSIFSYFASSDSILSYLILSYAEGSSISNAVDTVASTSKAQTIKENVMLFEDILEDLQAGYVDPVNPTKLFETAVSAMLKVSTVHEHVHVYMCVFSFQFQYILWCHLLFIDSDSVFC